MVELLMKKANILLTLLLFLDLIILSNYKEIQMNVQKTFSYDGILVYWFYYFPMAYLIGGYLMGQLLLQKGEVSFNRYIEKGLMIVLIAVLFVYFVGTILLIINYHTSILSTFSLTTLKNCIMKILTKYVVCFSTIGLLLSFCVLSYLKRR